MVRIGNFLFLVRNGLFPVAYAVLLIPSAPIFAGDLTAFAVGLALAIFGQIIRFYSIALVYIIRGGRNRRVYAEDLVTEGMFAHCRNPLYAGNYLIIVGVGVAVNSLLFLIVGGLFFIFAYYAIIRAEEDFLRSKFGAAYDDYCAAVPRILPKLHGIGSTIRSHRFNWKRLLLKEYGSTFVWIAGLIIVLLVKDHRLHDLRHATPLYWVLSITVIAYAAARVLKKGGIVKE